MNDGLCSEKGCGKKGCRHTVYHTKLRADDRGRGDENGIIRAIKNTSNLQSHETDRRCTRENVRPS